jgi:hypothetical protein
MFETRGSAAFVAVGDLQSRAGEIVEKAQEKPVYLLRAGEPIGCIVSLEMLDLVQDVLEDRYISSVAGQRLQAIRKEQNGLVDEEEFWARADGVLAKKR